MRDHLTGAAIGIVIAVIFATSAPWWWHEVWPHHARATSASGPVGPSAVLSPSISAITCPRIFDKAHDLLDQESTLAAPPPAGIAFTPNQYIPGRVDLTLTWINPSPISQSAIAIEGVYGQADPNDYFIDHQEPAAGTGGCWNWYHYGPRNDGQPESVRLQVTALWPYQQYCFYTVFRDETGYSKPTTVRCEVATWKSTWGAPAQAPKN